MCICNTSSSKPRQNKNTGKRPGKIFIAAFHTDFFTKIYCFSQSSSTSDWTLGAAFSRVGLWTKSRAAREERCCVALLSVRYRDPDNDTLKNKIDVAIEWSMKGTATVEPLCPRVRRFCASIEEKRCSMRSVAAVDYTSAGPMICRHQVMQHARLWQKKLWKPSNNSVTFGAEDTPERLPSYSYSDFFPFYFGFLPNSPNSSLKNL